MFFVILFLAVFFALNMGGSSFAAAFAPTQGSKILSQRKSQLLFIFFVMLGAALLGKNVTATLGNDLIPSQIITMPSLLVIFLSASISMFVGNIIHIPQSTSMVTVAAIAGVGYYHHQLNTSTIYYCLGFWLILPVISFIMTYYLAAYIYPPRNQNFWVYEKYINQRDKLKTFAILTSCFNAFSVGTNNVSNVVGPWSGFMDFSIPMMLVMFALFYGLGGIIFTGSIKKVGEHIVPLGLLTVSIISLVSGTLMLIASFFGVPQSFVMLQMGALFAVAARKNGIEETFNNEITRKTLYSWSLNPVIAFGISFGLMCVI